MQHKMLRNVIQKPTTLIKPQYATIRDDRVHRRNVKASQTRNKGTYALPHINVFAEPRLHLPFLILNHIYHTHSQLFNYDPFRWQYAILQIILLKGLNKRSISRISIRRDHKLSVNRKLSNPQTFPLIGLPRTSINEIRWEIRVLA